MVSFGGMNIPLALVDAERRILVLEKIVEQLINHHATVGQRVNIDLSALRADALSTLQEKYPDLGIKSGA